MQAPCLGAVYGVINMFYVIGIKICKLGYCMSELHIDGEVKEEIFNDELVAVCSSKFMYNSLELILPFDERGMPSS